TRVAGRVSACPPTGLAACRRVLGTRRTLRDRSSLPATAADRGPRRGGLRDVGADSRTGLAHSSVAPGRPAARRLDRLTEEAERGDAAAVLTPAMACHPDVVTGRSTGTGRASGRTWRDGKAAYESRHVVKRGSLPR